MTETKMEQRGRRFCTPKPDRPSRDRAQLLVAKLHAEGAVHRDAADDCTRAAMTAAENGDDPAEWIAKAQAFKRRNLARALFTVADRLEDWANGRESLETMSIEGVPFAEMFRS